MHDCSRDQIKDETNLVRVLVAFAGPSLIFRGGKLIRFEKRPAGFSRLLQQVIFHLCPSPQDVCKNLTVVVLRAFQMWASEKR